MKTLYRASVTAKGGRDGTVATSDDALKLTLSKPAALGGSSGREGSNPEQLFAAAYSASFLDAMKSAAERKGVVFPDGAAATAIVGVGQRGDGLGFGLDIELGIALPGLDHATAEAIVLMAHAACAYSHAMRTNVDVRLSII